MKALARVRGKKNSIMRQDVKDEDHLGEKKEQRGRQRERAKDLMGERGGGDLCSTAIRANF